MQRLPSRFEHPMTSRPEGKAKKGMRDIWIGNTPCEEKVKNACSLFYHTSYPITESEPEPRLRAKLTHMVGHLPSGTSCPCRDGILSWLDGWPVRWRAGAQAWLDA